MIGPCDECRFWKYKNTVHQDWGHCKRAQEASMNQYEQIEPADRPRMVAIGSSNISGIFATHAQFRCNEFQPKT